MTMKAGTAVVDLDLDDKKLDSGLTGAKKKVEGLGSTMKGALGAGAGFAAAEIGMQGLSGGFDLLIGNAANFEKSLGAVRAATGATAEEMDSMRELSLKIGADTSKSASEAVLAMGELAKAGMPVSEILDGAALSAVQMSEATGISVPAAAVLMSNALNTFQADGLKSADAAAIFAKAANASAIGVEDLGMSLAAVGPVAAGSGVSMEEFATVMGLFGNNAMRGSDAGTSFKAFLSGLTPASDKAASAMERLGFNAFDAEGNFKDMRTITKELGESFGNLTEEQKATYGELIFGSDGVRGMNILLKEGVEGWDGFGESMAKAPSLAEQSAMRMEGLAGQWEMFMGSVETVSIGIGSLLLPALTALMGVLISLVNAAPLEALAAAFGALGSAIAFVTGSDEAMAGFAAALMLKVIPALIAATGAVIAKTVALWAQVAAWVAVNAASLGWMLVIGLLVAAIVYAIKHWDEIKAVMLEVASAVAGEISASWEHLKEVVTNVVNTIAEFVTRQFNAVKDFLSGVMQAIVGFVEAHWKTILAVTLGPIGLILIAVIHNFDLIKSTIEAALQFVLDIVTSIWTAVRDFISGILNAIVTEVSASWNHLLDVAGSVWNTIYSTLSGIATAIYDEVSASFNNLVGKVSGATNEAKDALVGGWDEAKNAVSGVVDSIVEAVERVLRSLIDKARSIGREAGNALLDGLKSIPGVGTVIDAAGGIGGALSSVGGALFGGDGWASGGRPPVGELGVFGEEGPELWIPDHPGTVLNHDDSLKALAGAGGLSVQMQIDKFYARDRADAERSSQDTAWALGQAARERGVIV